MPELLVLGLVGFGAQLVNTALGMGYGVASTTFLLTAGTTPALAAATVHLSQIGSQCVSGVAHWRLGNVDWRITWRVGVPGAVGAFAGATVLSWLAVSVAGPLMAGILVVLGGYILVRFTVRDVAYRRTGAPARARFLVPLGLVAGFLNATGGGGWGPVGTSTLLASGHAAPRTVIGSVSAAECLVVTSGSVGFLFGLGLGGVHVGWVLALLAGGLLAAPAAAWLARHLPARLLGVLVGGFLVVLNTRSLLVSAPVPAGPAVTVPVLGGLTVLWAGAVAWSVRSLRAVRAAQSAQSAAAHSRHATPLAAGEAPDAGESAYDGPDRDARQRSGDAAGGVRDLADAR